MNDIIKNYDEYVESLMLNEGLTDGTQSACNKAFLKLGTITFEDGSTVTAKEIVRAVEDALLRLSSQFRRTFEFASKINIIYLAHSSKYQTMAVDECLNMYMNAGFIYHTLKMDPVLIGAVIMHEVFHVLFDHIKRGKNWLASKGKPVNAANWHDNNLAADVEVNQSLVRLHIIDEDRLINEIRGMYLKNAHGELGVNTNVVPMETILNNDEYMKKLRSLCPPPVDSEMPAPGQTPEIETTEEFDKGYKDAWNKIAGLIKKYGYQKAWEKLMEEGIVNAAGEFDTSVSPDKVMGLNYLYVKELDDFINEAVEEADGQTYEQGFHKGLEKILGKLNGAVNPQKGGDNGEGGDGGEQGQEKKYKSGLKDEDLDEVDLPSNQKGKKSKGDGDGLPDNAKGDSSDDNQDDNQDDGNDGESKDGKEGKSQSQKGGKGGKGNDTKSSDDKLEKDIINKAGKSGNDGNENGSGSKGENGQSGNGELGSFEKNDNGIGGTGSFIDSKDNMDDVLKEAGYDDEDIQAINKVRERNKDRNSPQGIEKARQEMRNGLKPSDYLSRALKEIKIEASKYENVWKEVMEEFLSNKTRMAGQDANDVSINWKRKRSIALGNVGPQYDKVKQDPQDVNIYVDVSGSMDMRLLEVISMSLVELSQEYMYSGINICPWASVSNGIHKVDDFEDRDVKEITQEILKIISRGSGQCGGGTEAKAAMSAMLDVIINTLNDDEKDNKDDVHVVITDGEFDYNNIEGRISSVIKQEIKRSDVAQTAPENTFWMIYDAPENLQEDWRKEIKKGKLIFINSEAVINNK